MRPHMVDWVTQDIMFWVIWDRIRQDGKLRLLVREVVIVRRVSLERQNGCPFQWRIHANPIYAPLSPRIFAGLSAFRAMTGSGTSSHSSSIGRGKSRFTLSQQKMPLPFSLTSRPTLRGSNVSPA